MKKSNIIFLLIIGLLFFYVGNRVTEMYYLQPPELDAVTKIDNATNNISYVFDSIYISTSKNDIIGGIVTCGLFALAVLYYTTLRHNFMVGKEHGDAKWGNPSDMYHNKLVAKKYENNMLFTQTERMRLDTRKTRKNNNVLVIGGAGSGKTRFYVKPNLMQLHSSYVVTDPKGTI